MMSHPLRFRQILIVQLLTLGWAASSLSAAVVLTNTQMLATQQVNLLGINATLVGLGPVAFTFDVDGNNNSIAGGLSTADSLFSGNLPNEFAPLGVNGAPFELFSLAPELVTVTNNGTHLRVDTTFGLRVFVAPGVVGANFFTSVPSTFESSVSSLQDLTGTVLQDVNRPNDLTQIFVGDNLLGLPVGSLAGVSFNRTVAAVPEPSSFLLTSMFAFVAFPLSRRRRNCA